MIAASTMSRGVTSGKRSALGVQLVVIRPVRRRITSKFSADRASVTTKPTGDRCLIQAVLRQSADGEALSRAKMGMRHRRACFVDGLDNLNLTKCLAVSHLFSSVAFAS